MAQIGSLTWVIDDSSSTSTVKKLLFLTMALVLVGLGVGIAGFIVGHEHLYAITREVPWGVLISSYAFFAITSTGLCIIAALGHAFGGDTLSRLGNRAVYLSIITILSAFMIIGFELVSPWRLFIYNVLSPNFSSNIWWMGTLYGLAVGLMILEFGCILFGRYGLALALGALGVIAEVGANTNLGAVFSTLAARPFWYGAQLPVYFLASAVMCGAASIILFTHFAYLIRNREMETDVFNALKLAGKILALMIFLIGVATVWRIVSFMVGGSELGIVALNNLLYGPLAFNFWIMETLVGLVMPFVILLFSRMNNIFALSSASLMVLVGAFFQRYDLVVNGQKTPVYYGWDNLPAYLSYSPSIGEMLLVMGAIAFTFFGFLAGEVLFGKVLNKKGH